MLLLGVLASQAQIATALSLQYLVIAGGGGGGGGQGGGGGAGGYRSNVTGESSGGGASAESEFGFELGTSYTVTVGAGGAGGTHNGSQGASGSNSVFSTITSTGGGGAGGYANNTTNSAGLTGGSGGGSGSNTQLTSGGSGTANQGYDGGDFTSYSDPYIAAGGGGAGAAAGNSNGSGSAGGNGVASSITGTSITRAGGGGAAGSSDSSFTLGGSGGGGVGGNPPGDGQINTGSGGGGSRYNNTLALQGGDGGSGVVILKYPDIYSITVGAGLVSSTVTSSSYAITTFFSGTDTISFASGSPLSSPPVSGYSLWLDGADDSSFTYSSGAIVSSWADKSGNGYDFTQATVGSQPTRLDDGFVSFDGSDDRLAAASKFMNAWHNGTSTTLFIVVNRTSTSGHLFGTEGAASANIGASTYLDYALAVRRGVSGSNAVRLLGTTAQAAGEKAVWTIRTDADNGTAANRGYFYLNDGAAQQTNTDTGAPSASDSTYVPAIGGNGSYFGDGKVAEIIWYESDLSTSDREAVRDYLIEKWGIA